MIFFINIIFIYFKIFFKSFIIQIKRINIDYFSRKTVYCNAENNLFIYEGNDKDIANLCTRKIAVRNDYETKALLDCFGRRDI